jgi:hypothetical protein
MVEVTYELTPDDFKQGLLAHRRSKKARFWALRILMASGGALVVVMLLAILQGGMKPELEQSIKQQSLPFVAIIGFWVLAYFTLPAYAARKQFSGAPSLRGVRKLSASEEGVAFASQLTEGTTAWSTYVKWLENDKVFALMSSNTAMVVIPKRAFSEQQAEEFRRLLQLEGCAS